MNREENAPFMYEARVKTPENSTEPNINRTRLWASALSLSALLVLLGFDTLFSSVLAGINVPLAVLCCYLALSVYDKNGFVQMFRGKNAGYLAVVVPTSLAFIYTDNDFLLGMNACVCVLVLALHIAAGFGVNVQGSPIDSAFFTAFARPFLCIGAACKFIFGRSRAKNKGIVVGCVLGGGMFVFVSVLLAGADEDFAHFIAGMFGGSVLEIVLKIFAIITGFFLISSLFYSLALPAQQTESTPKCSRVRALPVTIVGYFTALPIMLFAGVRLSSVGEGGFAHVAREGFFELTFVAAFVFAFVFFAIKKCSMTINLKVVLLLLLAGIMLLLFVAFSRMVDYERAFGFTRLRVYTQAFMILLFVFVILCALRIFMAGFNLVRCLLLFGVFALVCLTYFRPDAYIARQNVQMREVDYNYLTTLSLDAYPHYAHLIPEEGAGGREGQLNMYSLDMRLENSKDPMSFNLSRMQALDVYAREENVTKH